MLKLINQLPERFEIIVSKAYRRFGLKMVVLLDQKVRSGLKFKRSAIYRGVKAFRKIVIREIFVFVIGGIIEGDDVGSNKLFRGNRDIGRLSCRTKPIGVC